LPIHARRAFVGPDLRPGRRQRLGREHLIHQTDAVGLTVPRFACAQDVPSIAYESVPDLLRLPPPTSISAKFRASRSIPLAIFFVLHRGNSTGPAYGAAAAQLLEFDGNGDYLRPDRAYPRGGENLSSAPRLTHEAAATGACRSRIVHGVLPCERLDSPEGAASRTGTIKPLDRPRQGQ
jgi:hypothetical protein